MLGSRKLGCSKEQAGCSRCIYEDLECHYSEQKPMGRPRKRRCNNETKTKTKESAMDLNACPSDLEPLPFLNDNFPIDPYLEHSSLLFESGQSTTTQNSGEHEERDTMHKNNLAPWTFDVGAFNMPMNFGAGGRSFPQPDIPDDPIPIIPYNIANQDNTQLQATAPPCSCLATIYLALSSLQEFPSDVEAALGAIRSALNTAQAVLRCGQCCRCGGTPRKPSTEALQNTMLLNTLLPVIVNSYRRLLEMVDSEANIAKAAGYQMNCKIIQDSSNRDRSDLFGETESVENVFMAPDDWRAGMHRLLRADVYGHDMVNLGLKSILAEMEQRQRNGHLRMEKLSHFGLMNISQERQCLGEDNAPCLLMLNITKIALESLAIS
jgi:hypothetical protein